MHCTYSPSSPFIFLLHWNKFSCGYTLSTFLTDCCSSEPYSEVYGNLYHYIAQVEDISASDKYTGFVLKKEGGEFVQQSANLFKYDLLYNPLRFESWQKLANLYDEVMFIWLQQLIEPVPLYHAFLLHNKFLSCSKTGG